MHQNQLVFLILLIMPTVARAQNCVSTNLSTSLVGEKVRVELFHNSGLWREEGYYVSPESNFLEDLATPIFAGGLWMGGKNADGFLRLAASMYGWNSETSDYFPGPIKNDGTLNNSLCNDFNRFWTISKAEIEAFQNDFADGQLEGDHLNIKRWPAKGNLFYPSSFGIELPLQDLAPFVDQNKDGVYNPLEGDFPLVKGDQNVWWVFNDMGHVHSESQSDPIGAEIQVLVYTVENTNSTNDYATFYDFTIRKKTPEPLDSFYVALFIDADLGCDYDDYFGCIPEENLAFVYNQDQTDGVLGSNGCSCGYGVATYCEEIPLLGFKLLDGFHNQPSQKIQLSSFVPFISYSFDPAPPCAPFFPPANAQGYYDYMKGWTQCGPMSHGAEGYDYYPANGASTTYAFPDNPADPQGWSMCTIGYHHRDVFTMSFGPVDFELNDKIELSIAVLWVPDVPHPCPDITPLIEAGQLAQAWYNQGTTSTTSSVSDHFNIKVQPNPMTNRTRLVLIEGGQQINSFRLYDSKGKIVRQMNRIKNSMLVLERTGLSSGIYFYQVTTNSGSLQTGKIIVQ